MDGIGTLRGRGKVEEKEAQVMKTRLVTGKRANNM